MVRKLSWMVLISGTEYMVGFIVAVWEMVILGGEFQQDGDGNRHWMYFNNGLLVAKEDYSFYLTVTIDLKKNSVEVFYSGDSVGRNDCQEGYLDKNLICDESVPFTIGMMVSGATPKDAYSGFKLYGCRFYDRILNAEEIKLNYEGSKGLLNNVD